MSNFQNSAFVIQDVDAASIVIGNSAVSENSDDRVLQVTGKIGTLADNKLLQREQ